MLALLAGLLLLPEESLAISGTTIGDITIQDLCQIGTALQSNTSVITYLKDEVARYGIKPADGREVDTAWIKDALCLLNEIFEEGTTLSDLKGLGETLQKAKPPTVETLCAISALFRKSAIKKLMSTAGTQLSVIAPDFPQEQLDDILSKVDDNFDFQLSCKVVGYLQQYKFANAFCVLYMYYTTKTETMATVKSKMQNFFKDANVNWQQLEKLSNGTTTALADICTVVNILASDSSPAGKVCLVLNYADSRITTEDLENYLPSMPEGKRLTDFDAVSAMKQICQVVFLFDDGLSFNEFILILNDIRSGELSLLCTSVDSNVTMGYMNAKLDESLLYSTQTTQFDEFYKKSGSQTETVSGMCDKFPPKPKKPRSSAELQCTQGIALGLVLSLTFLV